VGLRGGLVCKAHRRLYQSTLGLRIKKKKVERLGHATLQKRDRLLAKKADSLEGDNQAGRLSCVSGAERRARI